MDIKVGDILTLPSTYAARHRHGERERMRRFYCNDFCFVKKAAAEATETMRTHCRHINITKHIICLIHLCLCCVAEATPQHTTPLNIDMTFMH